MRALIATVARADVVVVRIVETIRQPTVGGRIGIGVAGRRLRPWALPAELDAEVAASTDWAIETCRRRQGAAHRGGCVYGEPARNTHEYQQACKAAVMMACESPDRWSTSSAREPRVKEDGARKAVRRGESCYTPNKLVLCHTLELG